MPAALLDYLKRGAFEIDHWHSFVPEHSISDFDYEQFVAALKSRGMVEIGWSLPQKTWAWVAKKMEVEFGNDYRLEALAARICEMYAVKIADAIRAEEHDRAEQLNFKRAETFYKIQARIDSAADKGP